MADLLLEPFVRAARYGNRYSLQSDPWIMDSDGSCILTALPYDMVQLLNTSYITKIFFNSDIDVALALIEIERQGGVGWTYVSAQMADQFLW